MRTSRKARPVGAGMVGFHDYSNNHENPFFLEIPGEPNLQVSMPLIFIRFCHSDPSVSVPRGSRSVEPRSLPIDLGFPARSVARDRASSGNRKNQPGIG